MKASHPEALKMLDVIQNEIEILEDRTIKEALGLLRENKLTPELAFQFWCEISAYHQIPRNIKKQTRIAKQKLDDKPVDTIG